MYAIYRQKKYIIILKRFSNSSRLTHEFIKIITINGFRCLIGCQRGDMGGTFGRLSFNKQ